MRSRTWLAVAAACVVMAGATSSAAADDVVLYASDAVKLSGNWTTTSSTTAAGGQLLTTPDAGFGLTDTPLASPTNYVEFTFNAPPNTAYHVWVRLRASGNTKTNDSVFLQFSDAVTSAGAALHRIGTTNALLLNRQNCSGCAFSGWGWFDNAYWLSQASTLRFSGSGTHTLRVQTREDGVQLDQVVLSQGPFLSSAPGQADNDATIVTKAASGGGSTPFLGAPVSLPGTVQAENFDTGSEGTAYHDVTSGNSGGAYRTTDVDLEGSSEEGFNIGWAEPGEWLNYTVDVASPGSYLLEARVAAAGEGGTFHIEFGGTNVTGALKIPDTGGWQAWRTLSTTVSLSAGRQLARLVVDTSGANASGNFNWFRVSASSTPPVPPPSTGRQTTVPGGGDLQAAIDNAQPGDTLLLAPGVTYVGNFVLPAKSGSSYITIMSGAPASSLPGPNTRMLPSYSGLLPRLRSPNSGPAISVAAGAHHYRLQWLEFLANPAGYYDIIALGDGSNRQTSLSQVPYELILDRLYMHGSPTYGQKRAIALNSASTTIINSYISDIWLENDESQAIAGWNGPGPYTISNNYLEAATENILFGGSDPKIPYLVPSDITITRNFITKRIGWKSSMSFNVKNLVELKNAQRVVISGNVIENNWIAAQNGYAILFTPRNQEGTAPWTVVQQVEFSNNIVRQVSSAINILGQDFRSPSQATNNITIRNNRFNIDKATYGGDGRLLLINGGSDITVDHNTVVQDGTSVLFSDERPVRGFSFTNNIVPDNGWAIIGSGTAPGNGTITTYYPNSQFFGGIYIGARTSSYPTGNYYPASISLVGFVDYWWGNYQLSASSIYRNAGTDGRDVGCDLAALNAATAGVEQ